MTNLEITNAYVGSNQVIKIYMGGEVIYPTTPPVPPVPVYSAMPLTFEIISGGTLYWKAQFTEYTTTIEYSRDNGSTWTSITSNTGELAPSISVDAGDIIQFRGYNDSYSSGNSRYNNFSGSSVYFKAYGNIMSLFYGDYFASHDSFPVDSTYNLRRFFQETNVVDAENLVLPATALTSYCYGHMFYGCTSLTSAPELPATTLANYCYTSMFSGCGNLTKVPSILPATILNDHSYFYMFENCTSLTTAPELPATALAVWCYMNMFDGCTSLTTAPALPATKLAPECYHYMFWGCTSLTAAPTLPATTLEYGCYNSMFRDCTSLTAAPALPATTLAGNCYEHMFYNCTSLTTAPELPATTLAGSCYYGMFQDCTSLTTAPELPATTLATDCYREMFDYCTSLNYIKCLATDISANECTSYWVRDVASSGTFVKDINMSDWTVGNNGIPANWVVENYPPVPVEDPMLRQPLTVEITSVGTAATPQLGLCLSGWTSSAVTNIAANSSAATYITYTINGGAPQIMALSGAVSNSAITKAITGLAVGDVIRFYATSGKVGSWPQRDANRHALGCATDIHTHFVHTAGLEANVYGNINSLLVTKDEFDLYSAGDDTVQFNASAFTFECLFMDRSGFTFGTPTSEKHIVLPEPTNGLQNSCYRNMFYGCTSLTTAPDLPATTLVEFCYGGMFRGCTSLTTAPELPATTLADYCYYAMFYNCTSLTTAPELPVTTLTQYCYQYMFGGCTSLTTAPELPATTLEYACYGYMFSGCTSLTTAPELPATTLTQYCYQGMFSGCTNLNYIKCLATNRSARYCTSNWVSGVAASGTFVKAAGISWPTGNIGIPTNWTVIDAQ